MTEIPASSEGKRPALVLAASAILLLLLGLLVLAVILASRSPALLARGLEGSAERVEAAFSPEVAEPLRSAVMTELSAQVEWLRGLELHELTPEQARAAAHPVERLTDFLADERLEPDECRSFLDLSRRGRRAAP